MFTLGYVLKREFGIGSNGMLRQMLPKFRYRPMCKNSAAVGQGPRRYQYPSYLILVLDCCNWEKQLVQYGFTDEQIDAFKKETVPYPSRADAGYCYWNSNFSDEQIADNNIVALKRPVLHIPGITAPVVPSFYFKTHGTPVDDSDFLDRTSKCALYAGELTDDCVVHPLYMPGKGHSMTQCFSDALTLIKTPDFRIASVIRSLVRLDHSSWDDRKEHHMHEVDNSLDDYIKDRETEVIVMF